MIADAAQKWIASRCPQLVAEHLIGEVAALKSQTAAVGRLAESYPPRKRLLTWNLALGPDGELAHVFNRDVLPRRWGSSPVIWPDSETIVFPNGDHSRPPQIDRIVEHVEAALGDIPPSLLRPVVMLDIENPEHWDSCDFVNMEFFPQKIRRRTELARALKERLPGYLIGYWNDVPAASINYSNFPDAEPRRWLARVWRAQEELIRTVDYLMPGFSVEPRPSPIAGYEYCFTAAETAFAISETIRVAKSINPAAPVWPSIRPDRYRLWRVQPLPDTPQQVLERAMPAAYLAEILKPCFELGDGAFLWLHEALKGGERARWDWSLEWIGALERLLVEHGVTPWERVSRRTEN